MLILFKMLSSKPCRMFADTLQYWYVVRNKSYSRIFTAKLLFIAAALNWVWVNFLVMPSVL